MATGRLLPGLGDVIETQATGKLLPGFGDIVETESAAGAQTITGTGVASTLVVGTAKINQQVATTGVASTLAIGAARINLSVAASGIASGLAIGSPQLNLQIQAHGLASGLVIGTPTVLAPQTIIVGGLASSLAIGTPTVTVAGANQTITAVGVASTVAIGGAQLNQQIQASGVASTTAIGAAKLNQSIIGQGIASSLAIGSPTVIAPQTIVVTGIASSVQIGVARVRRAGDLEDAGGGGPDRSDDAPAERFTKDKSGWRKPQWVRDREDAAAKEAAQPIAPSKTESLEPALVERQALDASIGLERRGVAPLDVEPDPAGPVAAAQPVVVTDIERARLAARLRQERELELITTMLLMAA